MIAFSDTTAFRLVRRLATVGLDTPSLYLLISDAAEMHVIQADITAEVQVQLGVGFRALAAADVRVDRLEEVFTQDPVTPVTLITVDRWLPKLVAALDRNIVLLTTAGAVLLLANREVAERMLAKAPNLRNRVSDIVAIRPMRLLWGRWLERRGRTPAARTRSRRPNGSRVGRDVDRIARSAGMPTATRPFPPD
ncbi:MAG: hypothetical protein ABSH24_26360 [Bryobacteraceae bacterium]|jgi:hypothetical protein